MRVTVTCSWKYHLTSLSLLDSESVVNVCSATAAHLLLWILTSDPQQQWSWNNLKYWPWDKSMASWNYSEDSCVSILRNITDNTIRRVAEVVKRQKLVTVTGQPKQIIAVKPKTASLLLKPCCLFEHARHDFVWSVVPVTTTVTELVLQMCMSLMLPVTILFLNPHMTPHHLHLSQISPSIHKCSAGSDEADAHAHTSPKTGQLLCFWVCNHAHMPSCV